MRSGCDEEATQNGQRERGEGVGDAGDRLELGAEGGVEAAAHLGERGVVEGEAEVAGEDLAGAGEAAAEEAGVGVLGVEGQAGVGEGLEQEAEGDRLAVDQHAVAVEDDEAGGGHMAPSR